MLNPAISVARKLAGLQISMLQPPTYPSTSTLTATYGVSDEAKEMMTDRDEQERSVEDDDHHTISSGSDTEQRPSFPWRSNFINPNYPISIHNYFVNTFFSWPSSLCTMLYTT
ncbi:hypothetical protein BYT27DRAFT_6896199 [Phlegmacium glaucopus]|nr:hypothetical protein BYT27DRAFT_6896199 [Phlegmacium glaucopus]